MKDSFYFQHDYNAANDVKILYLRQQLGIEGYGIFWFVIEQLAQAGGKLPLKVIPVIAMQIQTTFDKVASVIKNYELFEIEQDEFFSVRLIEQIEFRRQLSEDGRAGALKRWGKQPKNSPPISPPISAPNAKERKGEESKESKEDIYDFQSNPKGLYIIVKDSGIALKIHQQSFEKYLDGTFGGAYEGQKMALRHINPPIEEFFQKANGNIFNNNQHVWASFKKIWIGKPFKDPRGPNPGKI